jgi:hypothetical protein
MKSHEVPDHLTPIDQCHQLGAFHRGDAEAAEFLEQIARACAAGMLVPDQDHRERWARVLAKTYEHHFGHPDPSAN